MATCRPLQPPDQSLDRTGLEPPPSTHRNQQVPGQGHQGSTGVRRVVVVLSPSMPYSLKPQHLSEKAAVRTQEEENPIDKTVEHRGGGTTQSSRLVLPLLDTLPGIAFCQRRDVASQ